MPKYVIEREIPDAGKLSREQLQAISQKSCGVLSNLGPQIQWVESYVMDDRVYCVYIAANEELIREHAQHDKQDIRKPDEQFRMRMWIPAQSIANDYEQKISRGNNQAHGEPN